MLKSGGWLRWVENRDIGRNISVMNRVPGRKMSGAEDERGGEGGWGGQGVLQDSGDQARVGLPLSLDPDSKGTWSLPLNGRCRSFEDSESKCGMRIISHEEHEAPSIL